MSTPLPDVQRPSTAAYLIFKDGQDRIAFLLRSNTGWKNGYYSLPAGKVEPGESFTQCALREAREEVGAEIVESNIHQVLTVNRCSEEDSDVWVDVFFSVKDWTGELVNAEPGKHSELDWFSMDNLPDKIAPPVREALDAIRQGRTYLESGLFGK